MPLKLNGADAPLPDPEPSAEDELRYGLRTPRQETEFELFLGTLSDDMKPHAKVLFQMGCVHEEADVVMADTSVSFPAAYVHCHCLRCRLIFKKFLAKTTTKTTEWAGYCPDGYDAFDWADLYVSDKSLWPYIFDAAEEALVADSMTKED